MSAEQQYIHVFSIPSTLLYAFFTIQLALNSEA